MKKYTKYILDLESGWLSESRTIALFRYLIKYNHLSHLPSRYREYARKLQERGVIPKKTKSDITKSDIKEETQLDK